MSWMPPELFPTASMPSERPCIRCGCVKARHSAGYCSHHGPRGCRRFVGMGRTYAMVALCVIVIAVAVALTVVVLG